MPCKPTFLCPSSQISGGWSFISSICLFLFWRQIHRVILRVLKTSFAPKYSPGEDPKWRLGHRCRLCELQEWGTLLRCWRHAWLR
jgi:hypothetical protein